MLHVDPDLAPLVDEEDRERLVWHRKVAIDQCEAEIALAGFLQEVSGFFSSGLDILAEARIGFQLFVGRGKFVAMPEDEMGPTLAGLVAERLDADAGEWFKENGGLLRKNGDVFRQKVLSKGGTMDAVEMYRDFRGRDPVIEPLLERRGLN